MGTTFGLHHILFRPQGCTPSVGPPPPPPSHGGKSWTSAQTEVTYPPPYFGVGEFKYAGIFRFLEKIFSNFCLRGLRIFFFGGGRRERRKKKIFFWKNHTCFLGHAPRKKGWGIHFWRNFSILTKKFFFEKKFLATKGGNDGRREQRKEGATGMILPRPYSKTWLLHCTALHCTGLVLSASSATTFEVLSPLPPTLAVFFSAAFLIDFLNPFQGWV